MNTGFLGPAVATVLTVYGIETDIGNLICPRILQVATVLTVYGIETPKPFFEILRIFVMLQQCLPFTVLKH